MKKLSYFSLCLIVLVALSPGNAGGQREATTKSKLGVEIEAAGRKLLAALREGNGKEVLSMISSRGLELGVDQPPTQLHAIRRDFAEKGQMYCAFFETSCLRAKDAEARSRAGAPSAEPALYSYREIIQRADGIDVKASIQKESGPWLGYVTLSLRGDRVVTQFSQSNPLEFHFVYEGGRWKLASIPNY